MATRVQLDGSATPSGTDPGSASARGYALVRRPSDVALCVAALIVAGLAALFLWAGVDVVRLREALTEDVGRWPAGVQWVLRLISGLGTPIVLGFVGALTALVFRQWRLARDVAVAAALAAVITWVISVIVARFFELGTTAAFPVVVPVNAFAVATVAGPHFKRKVRNWFYLTAVVLSIVSYLADLPVLLGTVSSAALGLAIGWGVLASLGRRYPVPDASLVVDALARVGIAIGPDQVSKIGDTASGSADFVVTQPPDDRLFVRVRGSVEREANVFARIWRRVRMRVIEDEPLLGTAKQDIERAGFLSSLAARNGVRVPEIAAASVGPLDETVLAETYLEAQTLADIADLYGGVSDAALRDVWRQVCRMHAGGIAHRELGAGKVYIDNDDSAWLTGFAGAQFAASRRERARDVAQLLVAIALRFGENRAVDTALEEMDRDELARALPLLQPGSLPRSTRHSLRSNKELLTALRTRVARASGSDPDARERLGRVQIRTLVGIVGLGVAIYVIWPNIVGGDFRNTIDAWRGSSWVFIFGAALLAVGTYFAAAAQVVGSVKAKISLFWAVISQIASDFMNLIAPAGIAGIGLTGAFIYKSGYTKAQAGAAITLRTVASFVMHFLALAVFLLIVGTQGSKLFDVGRPNVWVFVIVGVVVAAVVFVFAFGWTRRKIMKPLREGLRELRGIVRRPRQAAILFGSSLVLLMFYATAFYLCEMAFGAPVGYATAVTIWLGGSIVVIIWPVPGGVGGVEVVLTAALVASGVDQGTALAGVLTFRLLTFWLPIIPGYPAYRVLERTGRI